MFLPDFMVYFKIEVVKIGINSEIVNVFINFPRQECPMTKKIKESVPIDWKKNQITVFFV